MFTGECPGVIELLQVTALPPFLVERLEKEFILHDYLNVVDPDHLVVFSWSNRFQGS